MAAPRGRAEGAGGERDQRPLAVRFTIRYAIAVAAVAIVAIVAFSSVSNTLDDIEAATAQLEVATRQPGRVQRIVQLAAEIDEAGEVDDLRRMQQAAGQLEQEAVALRQAQTALLEADATLGIDRVTIGPRLEELYLGDVALDQRIFTYASTAEELARYSSPVDAENRVSPRAQLEEAEEALLSDLQQTVVLYTTQVTDAIDHQRDQNLLLLGLSAVTALAVVLVLFRPMANKIRSETAELAAAEKRSRESSIRATFRGETRQALEVCQEEAEVLAAGGRGLEPAVPGHPAELLMVEGGGDHLRRVASGAVAGAAGCPVDDPKGCAALRAGQTMSYESSRMLNVCPKLAERVDEYGDPRPPCSAVCVPMVFNGEGLGVLHATGTENEMLPSILIERLKILASETAVRLGTLRITKATEQLAARDPLTELDNRRTLFQRADAMVADEASFAIAVADLDHFKDLNDTYGHETGDRALQVFSDCLRDQLRPEDVVARYGGEEFVVLLPDTSVAHAARAIERVRVALAEEIAERESVPFTASWGLTDSDSGASFQEMLNAADLAMYEAKRSGRDRLVIDPEARARQGQRSADDAAPTDPAPDAPEATGPTTPNA